MPVYKGGGYMRKGVLYEGPTLPRGRPKKATLVVTAPKSKAKLSKSTKAAITSLIKTQQELKFAPNLTIADSVYVAGAGLNYNGSTNLNGWCSGPSQGTGIIPTIGQGASEGARIGNKIRPKYFNLRYSLNALETTDASSASNTNPFRGVPFMVRVIVFRHRYATDDYSQTGILNNGNTSEDIGNTIDDLFKPYNRDEYHIMYSKQFKMSAAQHSNTNGVTDSNVAPGCSPFIVKNVSIKLPKVLMFNDGTTSPTNQNMFMAVCVVNTNGQAISTSQRRLLINAEANLSFYDA